MLEYIAFNDVAKMNPILLERYIKLYKTFNKELSLSGEEFPYGEDRKDILQNWIYNIIYRAACKKFGKAKAIDMLWGFEISLDKVFLGYKSDKKEEMNFVNKINKILQD